MSQFTQSCEKLKIKAIAQPWKTCAGVLLEMGYREIDGILNLSYYLTFAESNVVQCYYHPSMLIVGTQWGFLLYYLEQVIVAILWSSSGTPRVIPYIIAVTVRGVPDGFRPTYDKAFTVVPFHMCCHDCWSFIILEMTSVVVGSLLCFPIRWFI